MRLGDMCSMPFDQSEDPRYDSRCRLRPLANYGCDLSTGLPMLTDTPPLSVKSTQSGETARAGEETPARSAKMYELDTSDGMATSPGRMQNAIG